jgi:uncharacterized protein YggE
MNRTTLLAAPILVAAILPASAPAQTTTEHTLSARGTGEVELKPDRGTISISVERQARTGEPARSRVARRVAVIVRGIRAEGVPRASITTEGITVRRVKRRKRPVHFVARTGLTVSVEGLDRLGRVIDVATRRGATDIFGPDMSVAPRRRAEGRRQAEAEALTNAGARAAAAAEVAGQRIVGVQSIDLDPDEFSNFDSGGASAAAPLRSTSQIFAGRQTFTATARVVYLIEPIS